MRVAGLFAGIGGFELGLAAAGHTAILLCENNEHAITVLKQRFPGVPRHGDICTLDALPAGTNLVAAGFPCQNLSMAGDKVGLDGDKSSLVDQVFRLLERSRPRWVLIENVYFMLHLRQGAAMESILSFLERLSYRWAYRVVDSRSFGLPQRRRRVFIVASQSDDPRAVLLADDAPDQTFPSPDMAHPIAFYWTEGRTGSGITSDAIPPLKAGSSLGIPSPPAVLLPSGRVVTPPIEAAERLQGFPPRWSSALTGRAARYRWRLIGNAVSVPIAVWIGSRLNTPAVYDGQHDVPLSPGGRWPTAAWNVGDGRMTASASELPIRKRQGRLSAFNTDAWPHLSERALRGFISRARAGRLAYPTGFVEALEAARRQCLL